MKINNIIFKLVFIFKIFKKKLKLKKIYSKNNFVKKLFFLPQKTRNKGRI